MNSPARLVRDFENLLDVLSRSPGGEPTAGVFPPLNITRNAECYRVSAELPGVDAGDLDITTEGTKLTITGKRAASTEGRVSYHRRERASGSFSRTVVLPGDFDCERVEAEYDNGILTITLPVSAASRPRQISVRAGER